MLFLIVRSILPGCSVLQHYRPDWLDGLELDIFVKEHNLGIEFQGIQHSEPMDHLGGEKSFRAVQRRDKKKIALCKRNGVSLIHIHEGEELKESVIRFTLHKELPHIGILSPQQVEHPPFDFRIESDAASSRWTNNYDTGQLFISAESDSFKYHGGGTDYSITVHHLGETVTSLEVWMQRSSGSSSFTIPVSRENQWIKIGRESQRMLEFFRIWATFDANIGFSHNEENNPTTAFTVREARSGGEKP